MPNHGTTCITITGPQADRAALHAALAATAAGDRAFSPATAAPEIWRSDGLLRSADMADTGDAATSRPSLCRSTRCGNDCPN